MQNLLMLNLVVSKKNLGFKELKEKLWRIEVTDKSNVQFSFQFWYKFSL